LAESAQRTLPPSSPQCIADWDDPAAVPIPCSSLLAGEPYHRTNTLAAAIFPRLDGAEARQIAAACRVLCPVSYGDSRSAEQRGRSWRKPRASCAASAA